MSPITTYEQLIQSIDSSAALWKSIEEGENLDNYELIAGIELYVARDIAEYALYKGLDYDIGRFKLSFIYNCDDDEKYDVLEGCSMSLLATFVEMLESPETVIDDYPLDNKYHPIENPDEELVAAAKYFYQTFWPDSNE